jgi:hypothetical protein
MTNSFEHGECEPRHDSRFYMQNHKEIKTLDATFHCPCGLVAVDTQASVWYQLSVQSNQHATRTDETVMEKPNIPDN